MAEEKQENQCSNCRYFRPDMTGDGFCDCSRQIYDYTSPDEYCIHHSLIYKNDERETE